MEQVLKPNGMRYHLISGIFIVLYCLCAAATAQTGVDSEESRNIRLQNPNLTFFGPANNALGNIIVDEAKGQSPWRLSQWHTPGQLILRPQIPTGRYEDRYPSHLSLAQYSQTTRNSRLAIFNTSSGLIFELGSAHGRRTAGGGQNLFIERKLTGREPVTQASSISLRASVPYIEMAAPTDNISAGQVFIGAVFDPIKPSPEHRGIFLQFVIADNRGARILTPPKDSPDGAIYASSNPEVGGAGIINFPLVRGRCALLGAQMTPVHINLFNHLKKALERKYEWTNAKGEKQLTVYPAALQNPSAWTLTDVYFGTEVQGPHGNVTARLANFAVIP